MNRSILNGMTAACLLALPVAPALGAPPAHDVQAGRYRVEPEHTEIVFSLLHLGFTPYSGMFSGVSGTLQLDPAHPAASRLDVSVPVSSIHTPSDRLTGELKDPDWFDAARYPNATFTSISVVPGGADNATITGNLTLHGVTRPVVLHARYIGAGVNPLDKVYTVGFSATAGIRRSDFGIRTYLPMVGDDVTLTIAGAFEKQD
ncbi:YceI family protein [Komagataeibacter europaeus]|uniref:YceI family protein n=1 Tax=Komagataeibacter europaeus TaxID=33995 RepID=UPI000237E438|nr:YceI family protein [Komagataeibacter europaeus]